MPARLAPLVVAAVLEVPLAVVMTVVVVFGSTLLGGVVVVASTVGISAFTSFTVVVSKLGSGALH